MSDKVDYKKEFGELYDPSRKVPVTVEVPPLNFLMIDGIDARPASRKFQNGIQALFGVSYKIKFISKKRLGSDYVVMPLEGLWWADDMDDFMKGTKKNWRWTLMIMQPWSITAEIVEEAREAAAGRASRKSLEGLRLEGFSEGLAAQIMHVGPFSKEHANITRVHEHIAGEGGIFDGAVQKHHEIYLSDFRKTTPERLRTVIRQPFTVDVRN